MNRIQEYHILKCEYERRSACLLGWWGPCKLDGTGNLLMILATAAIMLYRPAHHAP